MTNEKVIECLKIMKKSDGTSIYNDEQIKKIINNPIVLEAYKEALETYQNTMLTIESDFNIEDGIKVLKFK